MKLAILMRNAILLLAALLTIYSVLIYGYIPREHWTEVREALNHVC